MENVSLRMADLNIADGGQRRGFEYSFGMENVSLRMADLNIADGGQRRGFEYSFGMFWVEDEIIQEYKRSVNLQKNLQKEGGKTYLFEIRTNFKLKSSDGGEMMMMGSERFGVAVSEFDDLPWEDMRVRFRLKDDYWMSDGEIESLVRAAWNFANQTAAAAADAVIPVVVGLDVWTVQQEGETMEAAVDRAIRPESLIPIYVWPVVPMRVQEETDGICRHTTFFWHLGRIRVEDEQGLAVMETCPVCLRNSTIGAQISVLPCNHACHSRCVFQWLLKSHSCPSCALPIPPTEFRALSQYLPLNFILENV